MATLPPIPTVILTLIQKPPLLKGESLQEYNDLLGQLASDVSPVDAIEWLWLIQFTDCTWEIFRDRRFRAILIDLQGNQALGAVILKTVPAGNMSATEYNRQCALWRENPDYFAKRGIDPHSVPATARIQVAAKLELIDKSLERLQRRCDTILQQLEYRREVFAHRARHVVDKVLKVEHVVEAPTIVPPEAPLAIEPPAQARADESPSAADEVTIAPTLPAVDTPNSGETSPEVSNVSPSSDL
jgi:hypothetical protein